MHPPYPKKGDPITAEAWGELIRFAGERDAQNPDRIFYNDSEEEIPAYGLLEVTGTQIYTGAATVPKIIKPVGIPPYEVLLNGPTPVAAGMQGVYQEGPLVDFLYPEGVTPGVGDLFGVTEDSWMAQVSDLSILQCTGIVDETLRIARGFIVPLSEFLWVQPLNYVFKCSKPDIDPSAAYPDGLWAAVPALVLDDSVCDQTWVEFPAESNQWWITTPSMRWVLVADVNGGLLNLCQTDYALNGGEEPGLTGCISDPAVDGYVKAGKCMLVRRSLKKVLVVGYKAGMGPAEIPENDSLDEYRYIYTPVESGDCCAPYVWVWVPPYGECTCLCCTAGVYGKEITAEFAGEHGTCCTFVLHCELGECIFHAKVPPVDGEASCRRQSGISIYLSPGNDDPFPGAIEGHCYMIATMIYENASGVVCCEAHFQMDLGVNDGKKCSYSGALDFYGDLGTCADQACGCHGDGVSPPTLTVSM